LSVEIARRGSRSCYPKPDLVTRSWAKITPGEFEQVADIVWRAGLLPERSRVYAYVTAPPVGGRPTAVNGAGDDSKLPLGSLRDSRHRRTDRAIFVMPHMPGRASSKRAGVAVMNAADADALCMTRSPYRRCKRLMIYSTLFRLAKILLQRGRK
jgi:hypothetical protein